MAPRLDLLRLLADFLENEVPLRGQFDYNTYHRTIPGCGTMACALGWAASIPEWVEANYGLYSFNPTSRFAVSSFPIVYTGDGFWSNKLPTIYAKVLDLTQAEGNFLFFPGQPHPAWSVGSDYHVVWSPNGTATAKEVASHIRKFIEWKERQ